jgi:hypothetical protein
LVLFFATGVNDAGVVDIGSKFAAGIVDTGGKFATSINNTSETGSKFANAVIDTGGAPKLENISANFRKNLKRTVQMGYSGAGGKLIHEKKPEAKISRHCPFKGPPYELARY